MTDPFFHPDSRVESGASIGEDTKVWAFAHILPGARIGRNCNICDHTFIENDVLLGDRVTIKCGVYIWDGIELEDDVFIGPNVTFTNDPYPRSKQYLKEYPKTIVERGASIGAQATILPGLRIGKNAMVGAGAVVTQNVPPNAKVVGNPARIVGYLDTPKVVGKTLLSDEKPFDEKDIRVKGVSCHKLTTARDLRGDLTVAEWEKDIPFVPERVFFVYGVPSSKVRGEHAHRECKQFLVALNGELSLVADDGTARQEFKLDSPTYGVYLPPYVWGIQYRYSQDAVLAVFASHRYDADDYIRNYDTFLQEIKEKP